MVQLQILGKNTAVKDTDMKTKQEIRKEILEYRNQITIEDVIQKSQQIVQQVLKTPEYEEADHILLYADYRHEVMTRELFEDALLHKKKVYFPKVSETDCSMEFYQVVSVRQLETGYRGIREPKAEEETRYTFRKEEDTLMIIPGIAFDTEGYRIGYGKGFYDRYLQSRRQMTLMGLAFAGQIVEPFAHGEFDVRMDKVVTEEIIYSFLRI